MEHSALYRIIKISDKESRLLFKTMELLTRPLEKGFKVSSENASGELSDV